MIALQLQLTSWFVRVLRDYINPQQRSGSEILVVLSQNHRITNWEVRKGHGRALDSA